MKGVLSRTSSILETIWKRMRNRAYREAAVAAHVSNTIAAQIATMRESRGWTQTMLANKAGMRQSRISVLEDPNFENVEVATLRRIVRISDRRNGGKPVDRAAQDDDDEARIARARRAGAP